MPLFSSRARGGGAASQNAGRGRGGGAQVGVPVNSPGPAHQAASTGTGGGSSASSAGAIRQKVEEVRENMLTPLKQMLDNAPDADMVSLVDMYLGEAQASLETLQEQMMHSGDDDTMMNVVALASEFSDLQGRAEDWKQIAAHGGGQASAAESAHREQQDHLEAMRREQERFEQEAERKRQEEEGRRRAQQEEEARRAQQEEEARRRAQQEEEARQRAQQEEEARRLAQQEEEARQRAQQEEEARRRAQQEEEARQRAQQEEEARRRAQQEEEARQRAQQEEEARWRAQEEESKRRAQEEQEAKLRAQQEEEARRRAQQDEEATRRALQEEEDRQRAQQEEQARQRAQQEEAGRLAQQEQEAKQRAQQEEEGRLRAHQEEQARRRAQEEIEAKQREQREEEERQREQQEEQERQLVQQEVEAKQQAQQEEQERTRRAQEEDEAARLAQQKNEENQQALRAQEATRVALEEARRIREEEERRLHEQEQAEAKRKAEEDERQQNRLTWEGQAAVRRQQTILDAKAAWAARKLAEETARKREEDERRLRAQQEEEEAKLLAIQEEETRLRAHLEEEEARRRIQRQREEEEEERKEQARQQAHQEETERKRQEEERRRRLQEEEEEKHRMQQEEAKLKADEEERQQVEAEIARQNRLMWEGQAHMRRQETINSARAAWTAKKKEAEQASIRYPEPPRWEYPAEYDERRDFFIGYAAKEENKKLLGRRKDAESTLRATLGGDGHNDTSLVEFAVKEAREAGVARGLLVEGDERLKKLKKRDLQQVARQGLQSVLESSAWKAQPMRDAISKAREAEIPASELAAVEAALSDVEQREAKQQAMEEALMSRNPDKLRRAINTARSGGVEERLCKNAGKWLVALQFVTRKYSGSDRKTALLAWRDHARDMRGLRQKLEGHFKKGSTAEEIEAAVASLKEADAEDWGRCKTGMQIASRRRQAHDQVVCAMVSRDPADLNMAKAAVEDAGGPSADLERLKPAIAEAARDEQQYGNLDEILDATLPGAVIKYLQELGRPGAAASDSIPKPAVLAPVGGRTVAQLQHLKTGNRRAAAASDSASPEDLQPTPSPRLMSPRVWAPAAALHSDVPFASAPEAGFQPALSPIPSSRPASQDTSGGGDSYREVDKKAKHKAMKAKVERARQWLHSQDRAQKQSQLPAFGFGGAPQSAPTLLGQQPHTGFGPGSRPGLLR